MNTLPKIIRFWGICDLLFVSIYFVSSATRYHIPFYYEIKGSIEFANNSFGHPLPIYLAVASVVVYISLIYSGYLLFRRKVLGAVVSYIQTPFRFFMALPSLFFIFYPLKYLFDSPPVVLGMILILISEGIKLGTVIIWHRGIRSAKVFAA